jgi:hypothetical protein
LFGANEKEKSFIEKPGLAIVLEKGETLPTGYRILRNNGEGTN